MKKWKINSIQSIETAFQSSNSHRNKLHIMKIPLNVNFIQKLQSSKQLPSHIIKWQVSTFPHMHNSILQKLNTSISCRKDKHTSLLFKFHTVYYLFLLVFTIRKEDVTSLKCQYKRKGAHSCE